MKEFAIGMTKTNYFTYQQQVAVSLGPMEEDALISLKKD
jgi:hypothetical protein